MSEHGEGKKIIEQLDKVKHDLRNYAMISPRLERLTMQVQKILQCGYNHAAMIVERLERDKFISEPDFNGHRRLL